MGSEATGRMDWKAWAGIPILVAIIGAAAVIIPPLLDEEAPEPGAAGDIVSPTKSQDVPNAFSVEGTLSAIPPDHHVWVAVQIGNLLFPKEPEIPSQDRRFSQEVVEDEVRAGSRFDLALLMVDSEDHREIVAWLMSGRRAEGESDAEESNGYQGLKNEDIPGRVKLAVVRDLVMKPAPQSKE
jgi:hypothetical protein